MARRGRRPGPSGRGTDSTGTDESVAVGRVGRAHGIHGEVSVEPLTDEPERRFAAGSVLTLRTPDGGVRPEACTIERTRWHQGRLLVHFAEITDRSGAETLRGSFLEVPLDPEESPEDPEEFYDHQLVGLRVHDTEGRERGRVVAVEHTGAQDLLHIDVEDRTVLFPFVAALVPSVDVAGGRLVVDDRPGLLSEEA